jgi:hypothetical protein
MESCLWASGFFDPISVRIDGKRQRRFQTFRRNEEISKRKPISDVTVRRAKERNFSGVRFPPHPTVAIGIKVAISKDILLAAAASSWRQAMSTATAEPKS